MKVQARYRTIELSVGPVLFRLPQEDDIWALQDALPVLDVGSGAAAADNGNGNGIEEEVRDPRKALPPPSLPADPIRRARVNLRHASEFLVRLAKRPKLTLESVVSTDELVDVADLTASERFEAQNDLLHAAGYGKKEAERIAPLSETEPASPSSMPSDSDTESGPADSSASETLTPH